MRLRKAHNTQLSGVESWRADCECNMRDGLLRPSGEATASTACYAAPSVAYISTRRGDGGPVFAEGKAQADRAQ